MLDNRALLGGGSIVCRHQQEFLINIRAIAADKPCFQFTGNNRGTSLDDLGTDIEQYDKSCSVAR